MKKIILITSLLVYFFDSHGQNWQWSKHFGSAGPVNEYPNSIITDGSNVYVIGRYSAQLFTQTDTLYSNGYNDIFIIKYDQLGNELWAKTLGGNYINPDHIEDARAVYDSVNNCIYIAGEFINSIFLTGVGVLASGTGDQDIFLARMDLNGNFSWGKKISSLGDDNVDVFTNSIW